MELDELKEAWQKEHQIILTTNKKNMEQIQLLVRERMSETLSSVKGKYERIISFLFVGMLLNVIISPFLHYLLGDDGPVFRITLGGLISLLTLLIICLFVLLFYWIKYKSVQPQIDNHDVKKVLLQNIARLKRSLRQEILFIVLLFVATFIIARVTSQYLGHGQFGDIFRKDILLSILTGIGICAFYVFKRNKAYTKSIRDLQDCLLEFDEPGTKA